MIKYGISIGCGVRDGKQYWPSIAFVYDDAKPKIIYLEDLDEYQDDPFKPFGEKNCIKEV